MKQKLETNNANCRCVIECCMLQFFVGKMRIRNRTHTQNNKKTDSQKKLTNEKYSNERMRRGEGTPTNKMI